MNAGLMLNTRHGVYRLPHANEDFVRAFEVNAAVTCASAAEYYSLWTLKTPARLHLAAIDLDFLRRLLPGARNGRGRAVLDLVERGSDSLLETVARVLFRRHGFDVRTQVYLAGLGYVDFLLHGCLIVEIDGVGFHLNKPQFKKDIRRNNVGAASGSLQHFCTSLSGTRRRRPRVIRARRRRGHRKRCRNAQQLQ